MLFKCARHWIAVSVAICTLGGTHLSYAEGANPSPTTPDASSHPLATTVRYAMSHSSFIRKNVRDYSCRMVKRERINGKLQPNQFAQMKVRCERQREDGTVEPLSVFMQFVAPKAIKDRRVLYVADQNDGKLLVRKGGNLMKNLKLKVDPFSDRARSESKNPITEIGFDKLIDRLVVQIKDDMVRDPAATNTQVSHIQDAVINKRKCTHIRIVHPEQTGGMQFHIASLYMDDELHIPIRLVMYGWPEQEGQKPPVNEEYTYVDLRLNPGLTDADFSESLLDQAYDERTAKAANLSR